MMKEAVTGRSVSMSRERERGREIERGGKWRGCRWDVNKTRVWCPVYIANS